MKRIIKILLVLLLLMGVIASASRLVITPVAGSLVSRSGETATSEALRSAAWQLPTWVKPWLGEVWAQIFYVAPAEISLQGGDGLKLVVGQSFVLEGGQRLEGSLLVMGGFASLEEDSVVMGDVILMGGSLQAAGTIEGDVIALGGLVELGESALVGGDVEIVGGDLQRAEEARIEGKVTEYAEGPFSAPAPTQMVPPKVNVDFSPVTDILWLLFRSFLWAIVAILLVLFLPHRTEKVAQAIVSQPVLAGGLGLLTAAVAPLLLVVLAITILLIPLALVGAALLMATWAYGVVVVGYEAGKRLAQGLHQEWAAAVSAAVGVYLVTLVANTIGAVVPCVGWVPAAMVGCLGLGAVLLTRFGGESFVQETASAEITTDASSPEPESPETGQGSEK